MKVKTILFGSMLAASLLVSACTTKPKPNDGLEGTYELNIWVSETAGVKEFTAQQIRDFEAANPGIVIKEKLEGVTEKDSATMMLSDVEAGGDIYCFAQDQFARLVQGGALSKVGKAAAETIRKENDAGAVGAVTSGSDIYAYPLTSDNGYFLYYDTSVLSADDVSNMTKLLAKLEKEGKNISFEMQSSAWYLASYFFGAGCDSEWTTDNDGKFTSVRDTFNSENGLKAAKGIYELVSSPRHVSTSTVADFGAATPSAAVVSGTWDYDNAKQILGDNMGCAKLPTYTVDGKDIQLGSYSGNKLMGVKPQSDAKTAAVCSRLATYLTSQKCQEERFDRFNWGPSNKVVQAMEKVTDNHALAALAAQNEFAKPQGQIHGSWWDIAKVIASDIKDTDGSEGALKEALAKYESSLNEVLSISPETAEAFTVIGSFATAPVDGFAAWATDLEMTQDPKDTWTSAAMTLTAGDEFKVRQGKSWDVAFGADGNNYVVSAEEEGTHRIRLTVTRDGDNKIASAVVTIIDA